MSWRGKTLRPLRWAAVVAAIPLAAGATVTDSTTAGAEPLQPLLAEESSVVRVPTALPIPWSDFSAQLVRVADNGDVLGRLRPHPDRPEDPFPAPRIVVWRHHQPHDLGEGRPVDLDVHGRVLADRDGVVLRWDRLGGPARHLPLPADAVSAAAADMNARGDAAGTVTTLEGRTRPVLWPVAGGVVDLGAVGGAISVNVLRLTDDGKVIGTASGGDDGSFTWQWDKQRGVRPLARVPGRPERGLLPPATAVSPQGTYLLVGDDLFRLWHHSRGIVAAVDLDDVDAMSGSAVAVNDHGVVVGGWTRSWTTTTRCGGACAEAGSATATSSEATSR